MDCPDCGTATIAFAVPPDLREFAPDGAAVAAICPRCLTLVPVAPDEADAAPDFSRIIDAFPGGEAGVAMALAVGLLVESVTMHREAAAALVERVADAGTDPWIVLERLDASPTVDPDADLDRVRRQFEGLLE